jgi:hypothetical protein
MEDKNKAAASALCAKGEKAVAAETPDRWSAVGPWNLNTTGYRTEYPIAYCNAPFTEYGVRNTDAEVSCIVGNNWGLDMILDLVITLLVFCTCNFNYSQRYGVHEGCGKPMCTVPAALLPYSIPVGPRRL